MLRLTLPLRTQSITPRITTSSTSTRQTGIVNVFKEIISASKKLHGIVRDLKKFKTQRDLLEAKMIYIYAEMYRDLKMRGNMPQTKEHLDMHLRQADQEMQKESFLSAVREAYNIQNEQTRSTVLAYLIKNNQNKPHAVLKAVESTISENTLQRSVAQSYLTEFSLTRDSNLAQATVTANEIKDPETKQRALRQIALTRDNILYHPWR